MGVEMEMGVETGIGVDDIGMDGVGIGVVGRERALMEWVFDNSPNESENDFERGFEPGVGSASPRVATVFESS
jgi:hypothetical protein